jgi:hypothetical protein
VRQKLVSYFNFWHTRREEPPRTRGVHPAREFVDRSLKTSHRRTRPLSLLSAIFEPAQRDGRASDDAPVCRLPQDFIIEDGVDSERNSISFHRDGLHPPTSGSKRKETISSNSCSEYIPSSSPSSPSKAHYVETPQRMAPAVVNTVESGAARPSSDPILIETNVVDDPLDLDELLRLQQETLTHRRSSQASRYRLNSAVGKTARRKDGQSLGSRHRLARVQSLSEKWAEYLGTLPSTFLSSRDALANSLEGAVRGRPLFSGLHIDEYNNSDIQRVFRLCFESKIRLGQPKGTYDQFRSACGQYLRTYLSYYTSRARIACESGELFKAIGDLRLVRAFIGQYQVRASATTVTGKAMHLRRLADEAISYFTENDRQEQKGMCMSVSSYLRNVAASYKTEARRSYRSRNTVDDRIERGALLLPSDFSRCLGVATGALDGVVSYVQQLSCEHRNLRDFRGALAVQKGLLEKWSINLLAALVLAGGGQRPQVYAQLELPNQSDLQRFAEDCGGQKLYFALRAGYEKTTRSIDLPSVLFPRMMLKFIDCHVMSMRPAMLVRSRSSSSRSSGLQFTDDEFEAHRQISEQTLLLHTRHFRPLTSCDVKRTFSRFLGEVDPELAGITPMAIRGSYASMMLQARRRNEIMVDMPVRDVLEFLAKQMNTSCEQLATTYASCDTDGFESVANEVMLMLSNQHEEELTGPFEEVSSEARLNRSAASRLWGAQ